MLLGRCAYRTCSIKTPSSLGARLPGDDRRDASFVTKKGSGTRACASHCLGEFCYAASLRWERIQCRVTSHVCHRHRHRRHRHRAASRHRHRAASHHRRWAPNGRRFDLGLNARHHNLGPNAHHHNLEPDAHHHNLEPDAHHHNDLRRKRAE
jgi:hypothetical protein